MTTVAVGLAVDAAALADARRRHGDLIWRGVGAGCALLPALAEDEPVDIAVGTPPPGVLDGRRSLRWLQASSAGVEGIVAAPAFQAGRFLLTTASGIHASCAEHALALLLAVSRRIGACVRQMDREGWQTRDRIPAPLVLDGRTMLVLGLGAIGRRIVLLGEALGMRTVGCNRDGRSVPGVPRTIAIADLDQHLPAADVLMLVLPDTSATRQVIDDRRLGLLAPHAIVINVGRGSALDQAALLARLDAGRLGGAGLDVLAQEPPPDQDPVYTQPNLVLTPHIGGNRPDYAEQVWRLFMENLARFQAGTPLVNLVDRARGY